MGASPRMIDVDQAARVLHSGGVIAYPTEAVWGLGCDPFAQAAVLRLLDIKQRSVDEGLILVAGADAQFDGLVDWDALGASCSAAVLASWPGPRTWIVPATVRVPRWITGRHAGVAVRLSAHPGVVALCAAFGGVLVSTSANTTGQPAARAAADINAQLLAAIDGLVDGSTSGHVEPSSIRDARSGGVLRG